MSQLNNPNEYSKKNIGVQKRKDKAQCLALLYLSWFGLFF